MHDLSFGSSASVQGLIEYIKVVIHANMFCGDLTQIIFD